MARRHVREGEAHVERQRGLLARLRAHRHPTGEAEALLAEFESTLEDHRASLARILREQGRGRRDASGRIIEGGPLEDG